MAITADFSATTSRQGYIPLTVSFQDDTTGGTPSFRRWNFGDNTFVEDETNPSHTFTSEGIYNISLYVKDGSGNESTKIRRQYIIANGSYSESENTIIESYTPGKYWRFYIDEDLHIIFRYNNIYYKSKSPEAVLDKWMFVEFHPGDNFMYLGTGENFRKLVQTVKYTSGTTPTVSNDRLYIAKNSSFYIDSLRVWSREENLREYYRPLRFRAVILDR